MQIIVKSHPKSQDGDERENKEVRAMKREKFLWPLVGGHHAALMIGRIIQEKNSQIQSDGHMGALTELSQIVGGFLKKELMPHFEAEERIMEILARHLGKHHQDIERLQADHQALRALLKKGSLDALVLFAEGLKTHIRFEENELFPLLEKTLTTEEKKAVTLYLDKALLANPQIESEKETNHKS